MYVSGCQKGFGVPNKVWRAKQSLACQTKFGKGCRSTWFCASRPRKYFAVPAPLWQEMPAGTLDRVRQKLKQERSSMRVAYFAFYIHFFAYVFRRRWDSNPRRMETSKESITTEKTCCLYKLNIQLST